MKEFSGTEKLNIISPYFSILCWLFWVYLILFGFFLTELYTVKVLEGLNGNQKILVCWGNHQCASQWNIRFNRDGTPLFFKMD